MDGDPGVYHNRVLYRRPGLGLRQRLLLVPGQQRHCLACVAWQRHDGERNQRLRREGLPGHHPRRCRGRHLQQQRPADRRHHHGHRGRLLVVYYR